MATFSRYLFESSLADPCKCQVIAAVIEMNWICACFLKCSENSGPNAFNQQNISENFIILTSFNSLISCRDSSILAELFQKFKSFYDLKKKIVVVSIQLTQTDLNVQTQMTYNPPKYLCLASNSEITPMLAILFSLAVSRLGL